MNWFIPGIAGSVNCVNTPSIIVRRCVFRFDSAKATILLDSWLQNKGFLWQTEHRRLVYSDSEGVHIISEEEAMAKLLQAKEDGAVITEAGQQFITASLDIVEDA